MVTYGNLQATIVIEIRTTEENKEMQLKKAKRLAKKMMDEMVKSNKSWTDRIFFAESENGKARLLIPFTVDMGQPLREPGKAFSDGELDDIV